MPVDPPALPFDPPVPDEPELLHPAPEAAAASETAIPIKCPRSFI
jgi:hypothetical protein